MSRPISLIGAPTDIGAGSRGASMGPEALRVADIQPTLESHGLEVIDRGNLAGPANPWLPPVDILEDKDAVRIAAELPGVKKDDIQIAIDGAQVSLSAEVKREKEVNDGERWLHVERVAGKASRSFTLPQEVDDAKAEAKYRDGVYHLFYLQDWRDIAGHGEGTPWFQISRQ